MDERRQVTSEVRLRGRSSFPRFPSPLPGQCATRLRAEPTSVLCRAPRTPITSLLAAQHRLVPPSAGSSPGPPSRRTARPQEPADTLYPSRKPRSSRTSPAKPARRVRRLCLSRRVVLVRRALTPPPRACSPARTYLHDEPLPPLPTSPTRPPARAPAARLDCASPSPPSPHLSLLDSPHRRPSPA